MFTWMMLVLLLGSLLRWLARCWTLRHPGVSGLRRFRPRTQPPSACRGQPKPAWVKQEVLRLAALTGAGCRSVAQLFNRLYALPGMTGKGDTAGGVHCILGIEDHGTRALLALEVLPRRNAWSLLGHLFLAIGRFGKARAIGSDNEAIFRSRVFRSVLGLFNISQQFCLPGCPWMNGRIERLFGTLKSKLDLLEVDGHAALPGLMAEFRVWYNHVRPHQNLAGITPAEAWSGIDPNASEPRQAIWFEGWGGLLTGYYLRR